jgi:ADP-ribose pyrophosphatase YjhB (NUDIX family)
VTRKCDHKSVGILCWKGDQLLLIDRRLPPFGLAPPAGHVDEHRTYEAAARAELSEETGLSASALTLLTEGRLENRCRRPDGTWHYWKIYEAKWSGTIKPSARETKGIRWVEREEIRSSVHFPEKGGLTQIYIEPAWMYWFKKLV